MEYFLRFKKARKHQEQMINDIYESLKEGKNILVNAPTGIGKTDAALSASLTFAKEKNIDIFFLTPKISQHRIVVESLLETNKKFNLGIKFVDMVGKQNLCINEKINDMTRLHLCRLYQFPIPPKTGHRQFFLFRCSLI